MKFKSEFFHKGINDQKSPDVIISLNRPDGEKIKDWTVEQKLLLRAWINDIESKFSAFKTELLNAAK